MSEATARTAMAAVNERANPEQAADHARRFFKTGSGQYSEGDIFLGVSVPEQRVIAKSFGQLELEQITELIDSAVHEHRFIGLTILVARFAKASTARGFDAGERDRIAGFYLDAVNRTRVNNWDLVDSSAPGILGEWLTDRPREVLFALAASENLWHRRVALLANQALLRHGDATTLGEMVPLLLSDHEDLIHKAIGWMLREAGQKISEAWLTDFLDRYAARMPRTALSYACEKLSDQQRAHYRNLRVTEG